MVNGKIWDSMCQEKLNTLNLLPKLAKKQKCQMVVILGDVFDTSNPPEALKAEFVKIVSKFTVPVKVITGRPGDHDYVNENNYVLMDIREAFQHSGKENIYIHNSNFYPLPEAKGVLLFHDMLDGVNDLYKKTVSLNDDRFMDYETILMGDYHAQWIKKYGGKHFLYSGTPYPTRFGESCHGYCIVNINDSNGKLAGYKYFNLPTYALVEKTDLQDQYFQEDQRWVIKYKITCEPEDFSLTIRSLEEIKKTMMIDQGFSEIMDVVWEVKTTDQSRSSKSNSEGGDLIEVCHNYIDDNAGKYKTASKKLFDKFMKEVS